MVTLFAAWKSCRVWVLILVLCRSKDVCHVGAAGVLAIPPDYSRADVEAFIQEARLFAAEFSELSAHSRRALIGYCLRLPLQVDPPNPSSCNACFTGVIPGRTFLHFIVAFCCPQAVFCTTWHL